MSYPITVTNCTVSDQLTGVATSTYTINTTATTTTGGYGIAGTFQPSTTFVLAPYNWTLDFALRACFDQAMTLREELLSELLCR